MPGGVGDLVEIVVPGVGRIEAQRVVKRFAAAFDVVSARLEVSRQHDDVGQVRSPPMPVVVDAGIGAPSHAAEAMEMGADAVLVNTAIAVAGDPLQMALAFKLAVESGRIAHRSGLGAISKDAKASSPLTSFLDQ